MLGHPSRGIGLEKKWKTKRQQHLHLRRRRRRQQQKMYYVGCWFIRTIPFFFPERIVRNLSKSLIIHVPPFFSGLGSNTTLLGGFAEKNAAVVVGSRRKVNFDDRLVKKTMKRLDTHYTFTPYIREQFHKLINQTKDQSKMYRIDTNYGDSDSAVHYYRSMGGCTVLKSRKKEGEDDNLQ